MFENDVRSDSKRERTRAKIRDVAIESFVERGYADTTMREIATRAGVSVGNAYYHFPSKSHLVQELYIRVQQEHASAARPLLEASTDPVERLRIVCTTGLATIAPYRHIAPGFLAAMIPPDSPLNPLGAESGKARDLTTSLFEEALTGSRHRIPEEIAALLPKACFVGYLGLVLRWTYDPDPVQRSTHRLLSAGLAALGLLLPLLRLPGIRPLARDLLREITEMKAS